MQESCEVITAIKVEWMKA